MSLKHFYPALGTYSKRAYGDPFNTDSIPLDDVLGLRLRHPDWFSARPVDHPFLALPFLAALPCLSLVTCGLSPCINSETVSSYLTVQSLHQTQGNNISRTEAKLRRDTANHSH
jgi:hypothetical protein